MAGDGASDDGSVQVLRKSARILDCLSVTSPRLRASEICELTGFPATTVARILRTLVEENLLHRDGPYYSVGVRITAWSAAGATGADLAADAAALVEKLRDASGESAGLYVRHGNARVCVLQKESAFSIAYRASLLKGVVETMHAGAAGKVFMAFDSDALKAAQEGGLVAYTPKTVIEPTALQQQLDAVRRQGWAHVEEERELGLSSLAAPVFGRSGEVVAAVALAGPSHRLTSDRAEELASLVVQCATEISKNVR
jgi:DNA-binding IclR family transcriptional regulator